jgi:hypothetical protein
MTTIERSVFSPKSNHTLTFSADYVNGEWSLLVNGIEYATVGTENEARTWIADRSRVAGKR